jgi:hypothetical protein
MPLSLLKLCFLDLHMEKHLPTFRKFIYRVSETHQEILCCVLVFQFLTHCFHNIQNLFYTFS